MNGASTISTLLGKSVQAKKQIPGCGIKIRKKDLLRDLIVMPFEDYDLILGMDWLSECHAQVKCKNKLDLC
jgi:hypothetical protein